MMHLTRIDSDLYDIAKRVKEIDRGYYVVFNQKSKRYEIHNEKSHPTLCIIAETPLDVRAIDKLIKTHVKRKNQIIQELERENARLEKYHEQKISDKMAYKSKSVIEYLERGGREVPPYQEI